MVFEKLDDDVLCWLYFSFVDNSIDLSKGLDVFRNDGGEEILSIRSLVSITRASAIDVFPSAVLKTLIPVEFVTSLEEGFRLVLCILELVINVESESSRVLSQRIESLSNGSCGRLVSFSRRVD